MAVCLPLLAWLLVSSRDLRYDDETTIKKHRLFENPADIRNKQLQFAQAVAKSVARCGAVETWLPLETLCAYKTPSQWVEAPLNLHNEGATHAIENKARSHQRT